MRRRRSTRMCRSYRAVRDRIRGSGRTMHSTSQESFDEVHGDLVCWIWIRKTADDLDRQLGAWSTRPAPEGVRCSPHYTIPKNTPRTLDPCGKGGARSAVSLHAVAMCTRACPPPIRHCEQVNYWPPSNSERFSTTPTRALTDRRRAERDSFVNFTSLVIPTGSAPATRRDPPTYQ